MSNEPVSRFQHQRRGRRFLGLLGALMLLFVGIYAIAHWLRPVSKTFALPNELVHIETDGTATIRSPEDVLFTVGEERATQLLGILNASNQQIAKNQAQLREMRLTFGDLIAPALSDNGTYINEALSRHDYDTAASSLAEARNALSAGSLTPERIRLFTRMEEALRIAYDLRLSQLSTQSALEPPHKYRVFWMDPLGVLLELTAWTLFGVFASLLYHTAQHLADGTYAPREQAVAWTKLLYAPLVALAIVFSLWAGVIELGGPETRVWSIPLFGFLAGFNTRKAVELLDQIGDRIFARAAQSLDRPAGQLTATQSAINRLRAALPPPERIEQIRAEAKALNPELIKTEIDAIEKKS